MAHNNPMRENGHLSPQTTRPRTTRTMSPGYSNLVTGPLGPRDFTTWTCAFCNWGCGAFSAPELYFRQRSLSLSVGGLFDTCTNSVEELVAEGTVNCFLTRPNRGKTLLTINYYDFEWHVEGLLCKILSYLHVSKVSIYSFVTTQSLFGTIIIYNYDKLSYFQ